ncbi:SulP family inorganic anion transporter [Candidatus Odyssella thessalonicensis]|uniref:SulP family inorganic anion transporter n=1 Tax=Candidatus Odyssella thessalonicensis TaxID=84647 RepID=UPI000225A8BF|nr:SulP family inorganic anion transporter [Candidatus Odyssella thessalonicensis]
MLAFIEAYQAGLFQRWHWLRNTIAGIIVGIVALPLAMAFAIASGAKPEQGLYTAIVAGFCVSIFGGSRLQIAGPTGAFIVVLSGITSKYGIEGLQIATLMAGVILVLFGLSRMGSIVKFIPDPVIVGFTAGIAVIIWVSQWQTFFGLPRIEGEHFHSKLFYLLQALPHVHVPTMSLALLSLLLIIYTPRLPVIKRIPGPLVALVVATLCQGLYNWQDIQTIGSAFGGIPHALPSFQVPPLTWAKIIELIGPAFTIALLGAIESLLSAVVADNMAGTHHDSNQELIGQGLANIAAPLFGGFAATGAIARTATNIRNGATSPLAGIIHSITVLLILLVFAPLAVHIPLAVLAAILFVVAWHMSEAKRFIRIVRQAPQADVMVLLTTFFLTVFADLIIAVNIGIIVATLHFLRRMANSVEVRLATEQDLSQELACLGIDNLPDGVQVISIKGPFFFGAVESFEQTLRCAQVQPRILIIWLSWVPFIDMTGLQTLEVAIRKFHKKGVRVILCGANERVVTKMQKVGIIDTIAKENNVPGLKEALAACD